MLGDVGRDQQRDHVVALTEIREGHDAGDGDVAGR
jgi:hypothetical protein